jgi:hypothetical protein
MSGQSEEIIVFSQDLGETLYAIAQYYPQMFVAALQLSQSPPSPSAEVELMEIRQAATDMSDTISIYSRAITLMDRELQGNWATSSNDPRMIRPLLLDLLESAIMLAHVPSQADLAELSIITPEELQARLDNPQVAAWMNHNVTQQAKFSHSIEAAGQPEQYQPVSAPMPVEQVQSVANPYPQAPAESPYPQVEAAPVIPAQPQQAPLAPPEPQAPAQTEPWSKPIANPNTDGDRSRHRNP